MLKRSVGSLKRRVVTSLDRLKAEIREGSRQDAQFSVALGKSEDASLAAQAEEPPVVARMLVEIRSDGTRTIARGAMEDIATGERVAIKAQGTTPAQLAASLAKSLFSAPILARQAVKAIRRGLSEPKPEEPQRGDDR